MRVAFLGLGTMGFAMARRLLAQPWELVVWNRTADRAAPMAALGATVAKSAFEAAEGADVICTMIADPTALQNLCLDRVAAADANSPNPPRGIVSALKPGAVLVDLSTVGPRALTPIREAVRRQDAFLLDAPVSGSREPAESGSLLVLVGGLPQAIELARPVLDRFGTVRVVGGPGAGAATKLALNNLGAHMMSGLASSLVLAAKLGLDPADTLAVINEGPFRSPLFVSKGQRIVEGRFEPADFTVKLLCKDQDVVLQNAANEGLDLPTLQAVRALIDRAVSEGDGDKDLCAIVRPLERQAGILARKKP
jgi:3-hydroxyisobutyrate dehydrogenase-like beta-hydroxyacid dehydrogenase